ncbi:transcriptional regulator FtrA [Kluyvera sp. Awk 3]|uniref:transcriptional regulator FtrA n=1 Tax=Kluyvera sp. Awk 3 TaxID=2963956 RepID=UPI00230392E4|nr:transcriptional regulator FtrA [Kluyvera sp. Awk 3]MDA8489166.1 transcriptional regulator FtrA [Kluyvera sp. Awk 3]
MTENSQNMTIRAPLVVTLAYDGLCTFEFGVAVEVFGLPRPEMGESWYRFAVAAVDEGALRATGGVRVMADGDLSLLEEADTIIVPGWRGVDSPVPEALSLALKQAHRRGCRVLSICSGVFVLAAAGLLDGQRATTHWRYTTLLQQRYPAINVVDDVLYIAEGNVLTSAGSAAGIDLCLHVVRLDFGLEAANRVARRLVIQPHRDGAQKQQITRPVARSRESQRLGMLFDFLHQHLAESHSVRSLADKVGMSERTFLRRFQDATGKTPARWLLDERLLQAQHHLTTGRDSVEKVAEITGFGNAKNLRLRFQQHFAISPLAYRKRFTATNN